jgi:hypothetical protein
MPLAGMGGPRLIRQVNASTPKQRRNDEGNLSYAPPSASEARLSAAEKPLSLFMPVDLILGHVKMRMHHMRYLSPSDPAPYSPSKLCCLSALRGRNSLVGSGRTSSV